MCGCVLCVCVCWVHVWPSIFSSLSLSPSLSVLWGVNATKQAIDASKYQSVPSHLPYLWASVAQIKIIWTLGRQKRAKMFARVCTSYKMREGERGSRRKSDTPLHSSLVCLELPHVSPCIWPTSCVSHLAFTPEDGKKVSEREREREGWDIECKDASKSQWHSLESMLPDRSLQNVPWAKIFDSISLRHQTMYSCIERERERERERETIHVRVGDLMWVGKEEKSFSFLLFSLSSLVTVMGCIIWCHCQAFNSISTASLLYWVL